MSAGVLIDTFIIRPLLVPVMAALLGSWNWLWPGRRLPTSTVGESERLRDGSDPPSRPFERQFLPFAAGHRRGRGLGEHPRHRDIPVLPRADGSAAF
ncbi:MAG: hypothetical protein IMW90_21760 [Thermogemmatispora sp.]|uniref:hypothetical protein n=1 Tax=Thermogemmatispora sp. TaxID=1968838 RepID=UPI0019E9F44E|nr:hypothetical protein [Thermogemmatispora sp.]